MSDWLTLINAAYAKGYRVRFDAEEGYWVIDAPKAFRRPAQEHASFKTEDAARRCAALMASQD